MKKATLFLGSAVIGLSCLSACASVKAPPESPMSFNKRDARAISILQNHLAEPGTGDAPQDSAVPWKDTPGQVSQNGSRWEVLGKVRSVTWLHAYFVALKDQQAASELDAADQKAQETRHSGWPFHGALIGGTLGGALVLVPMLHDFDKKDGLEQVLTLLLACALTPLGMGLGAFSGAVLGSIASDPTGAFNKAMVPIAEGFNRRLAQRLQRAPAGSEDPPADSENP
jgi:hypothetical protein